MVEARSEARLAAQPLGRLLRVAREVQALDRHAAVEPEVRGEEHGGEAAGPETPLDAVAARKQSARLEHGGPTLGAGLRAAAPRLTAMPTWPFATLLFPVAYLPLLVTDSRLLRPVLLVPLTVALFVVWWRRLPPARVALLGVISGTSSSCSRT